MGGHQTRTGVLAWNSCILSSGSRDRNILQHDLRVSNDFFSKLVGHKSEVKRMPLSYLFGRSCKQMRCTHVSFLCFEI